MGEGELGLDGKRIDWSLAVIADHQTRSISPREAQVLPVLALLFDQSHLQPNYQ